MKEVQTYRRATRKVKPISVFACWLAAIAVVQADPDDLNVRRARVARPVQAQPRLNHSTVARHFYGPQANRRTDAVNGKVTGNVSVGDYHWRRFNLDNKVPSSPIASAKFSRNNRIAGSEQWRGESYSAFRSYQTQWHDRNWWRLHHP